MSAPLAPSAKPLGSPKPASHVYWLCCYHFSAVALDSDPSGSPWGLSPVRQVCDLPPLHPRQSLWGTKHIPSHFSVPLVQCPCLNAAVTGPP